MRIKPKNLLLRLLYIPMVPYFGIAISGLFFSDQLIFMPHPAAYRDSPDILKLRSTHGNLISAIYLVNPAARYTLLVSHGNGEDLGDMREWFTALRDCGFNVLAYDYQGYGTSQGRPSEKGTYDDEEAAYDYLSATLKTPAERIIVLGRSVGTGPATHLAARRPVAGLILQSPFLSAFRVVTRVPLLPFDKFPNYKEIRQVHCPVLIIHGTDDRVIGFWHGQQLFSLAKQPKRLVPIAGADHNDPEMFIGATYLSSVRDFASSLSAGQGVRADAK